MFTPRGAHRRLLLSGPDNLPLPDVTPIVVGFDPRTERDDHGASGQAA